MEAGEGIASISRPRIERASKPPATAKPKAEIGEPLRQKRFDAVMVFGQGPVKPVLLTSELTSDQSRVWEQFKADPSAQTEPDFRVVDGIFAKEIAAIDERTDVSDEAKRLLKEDYRRKMQAAGRFALNKWGRQNALAAGVALVSGSSERVILSGGKTMPGWAKDTLPKERIDNWPSEGQLMKDIIIRRFGRAYVKRFGRKIEDMISVEGASTNTLENFAYTINHHPDLVSDNATLGLLGADFHLHRISKLAELFRLTDASGNQVSAQGELDERASKRKKGKYEGIIDAMLDPESSDLARRKDFEEIFERGLTDPEFVTYWLGYIGDLQSPALMQEIIGKLNDPEWERGAQAAFSQAGLDFNEWGDKDLERIRTSDPQRYTQFVDSLRVLKTQRKMPTAKI